MLYARELETIGASVVLDLHAPARPRAGRATRGAWIAPCWRRSRRPGVRVYVCGPTTFVESVADDLVALGHEPANIRTERFGATGG